MQINLVDGRVTQMEEMGLRSMLPRMWKSMSIVTTSLAVTEVQIGSHIKAHLALRQPAAFSCQYSEPDGVAVLAFGAKVIAHVRSTAHSHVSCFQDCDLREILVGMLTMVCMR